MKEVLKFQIPRVGTVSLSQGTDSLLHRVVEVSNRSIRSKLGARIELSPLRSYSAAVPKDTKTEVLRLVDGVLQLKPARRQVVVATTDAMNGGDCPFDLGESHDRFEQEFGNIPPMALFDGYQPEQQHEDDHESSYEPSPEITVTVGNTLEEWIGTVTALGIVERNERYGKKKAYTVFAMSISNDLANGAVEEVRGADLERAVSAAKIHVGDRIHLRHVGDKMVPISTVGTSPNDKKRARRKRLFEVIKL